MVAGVPATVIGTVDKAGKRVNKVMHEIQILEPMARSNVYDFTEYDV